MQQSPAGDRPPYEAAIASIARVLTTHRKLDDLLVAALDALTVLPMPGVSIHVADEALTLHLAAHRNIPPRLVERTARLAINDPLPFARAEACYG